MTSQETESNKSNLAAETRTSPRRVFYLYLLPVVLVQFFFVLFIGKRYSLSCAANDFLATVTRHVIALATGIFLSCNGRKNSSPSSIVTYVLSASAFALLFYSKALNEAAASSGIILPHYLLTEIIPFLVFGYAIGNAASGGNFRSVVKSLLYSSIAAALLLSAPILDCYETDQTPEEQAIRLEEDATEMDVHLLFLQCGKRPVSVKTVCRDGFSGFRIGAYLPKNKNCVTDKKFFCTDRSIAVLSPILPETLSDADLVIIDFARGENEAEKFILSERFLLQMLSGNPDCTIAVRNTPENALMMKSVFPDSAVITGYDRTWLAGGKNTTSSVTEIDARAEEAQVYYECGGNIPAGLFSMVSDEIKTIPEKDGETFNEESARLFTGIAVIILLALLYFIVRFVLTGKPGRKEIFASFENGFLLSLVLTFSAAFSGMAGDGQGITLFTAFLLCIALGFVSGNAEKKEASSVGERNGFFRKAFLPAVLGIATATGVIFASEIEYRSYFFFVQLLLLAAAGRLFGKFVKEYDVTISPAAVFTGFAIGMISTYAFLSEMIVPACIIAGMLVFRAAARLLAGKA